MARRKKRHGKTWLTDNNRCGSCTYPFDCDAPRDFCPNCKRRVYVPTHVLVFDKDTLAHEHPHPRRDTFVAPAKNPKPPKAMQDAAPPPQPGERYTLFNGDRCGKCHKKIKHDQSCPHCGLKYDDLGIAIEPESHG